MYVEAFWLRPSSPYKKCCCEHVGQPEVAGGGRREKKRGSNLALATSALSRDDKMDPDLFLVKIEEKKEFLKTWAGKLWGKE